MVALEQAAVVRQICEYISTELLGEADAGIEADTPLLEWGVLNSLNISRLIVFVGQRFGVEVPPDAIVGTNFRTARAVADLVLSLSEAATGATAQQATDAASAAVTERT